VAPQHSDRSAIMTAPSLLGRGRRQSTRQRSGTCGACRNPAGPAERYGRSDWLCNLVIAAVGLVFSRVRTRRIPVSEPRQANRHGKSMELALFGYIRRNFQVPRSDLFIHRHSRSEISSRLSICKPQTHSTHIPHHRICAAPKYT
jgi:hypothetical protein